MSMRGFKNLLELKHFVRKSKDCKHFKMLAVIIMKILSLNSIIPIIN